MNTRPPRPLPCTPSRTTRRTALLSALAGASGWCQAQAETEAGAPIAVGNGPPITLTGMLVNTTQPLQVPLATASYQFRNQTTERYWVFSFNSGVVLDLADPPKVIVWYLKTNGTWAKKKPAVLEATAYLVKPDQLIQLTWPVETEVVFKTRPLIAGE